jgi:putative addiction module component (TIGR02574 family)
MDLAATREAVRALSIDERIELVQAIWDDIAAECTLPDLTEEQKAELDRRLASLEAAPDAVLPWEDVRSHVQARLRQ